MKDYEKEIQRYESIFFIYLLSYKHSMSFLRHIQKTGLTDLKPKLRGDLIVFQNTPKYKELGVY